MCDTVKVIEETIIKIVNKQIEWIQKEIKPSRFSLDLTYTFNKRCSYSFACINVGIKPFMKLSLYDIKEMYQENKVAWFQESSHIHRHQVIGSFEGTWQEHLTALLSHEMAHIIIDIGSVFDSVLNTEVAKKYDFKGTPYHHHSIPWRKAYIDMKSIKYNTPASIDFCRATHDNTIKFLT